MDIQTSHQDGMLRLSLEVFTLKRSQPSSPTNAPGTFKEDSPSLQSRLNLNNIFDGQTRAVRLSHKEDMQKFEFGNIRSTINKK